MKHTPVKPMESDDRMSFNQANRFLSTNGYLFGTQPNATRLSAEAQKLAAEMDCSFSPDLRRLFIACEDSGEYDACFIQRFLLVPEERTFSRTCFEHGTPSHTTNHIDEKLLTHRYVYMCW